MWKTLGCTDGLFFEFILWKWKKRINHKIIKCSFIFTTFTTEGFLVDKMDLLALYLSGTYRHKTGTRPPSCQLLDNRLLMPMRVRHKSRKGSVIVLSTDIPDWIYSYIIQSLVSTVSESSLNILNTENIFSHFDY